ncbi:hypothetical protein D3C72_2194080 [compost metagenome]
MGQGVAGQAPGAQFGQQLAVVHGSFHRVIGKIMRESRAGCLPAGVPIAGLNRARIED